MSYLDHATRQLTDQLRHLRRDLHQHPEVGLRLPETQRRVIKEIEYLELEVSLGQSSDSVVAVLRGTHPARRNHAVLLRGDMDGLPVTESTGLDFASSLPNRMHGCGHDLHTTMLIGAARLLSENRDALQGDVVFMFQPGEEGHDGAQHMIEEGLLEKAGTPVVAAYALHVFSAVIPVGKFVVRPGAIMSASDHLRVRVRGRGGHGSTPHKAADPIAAAAEMILALQLMVTRRFNVFDPVVLSVTQINAGQGSAIIPEDAEFIATVRSFSIEAQDRLKLLCTETLSGIAASCGVEVDVEYTEVYPATINDPIEAAHAHAVAASVLGDDALLSDVPPLTASEDFSRILQRVPGVFIPVGATAAGADPETAHFNHAPQAVFDESVLPQGAALLAELATSRLQQMYS